MHIDSPSSSLGHSVHTVFSSTEAWRVYYRACMGKITLGVSTALNEVRWISFLLCVIFNDD